jgi:hypothetical protein
MSGVEENSPNCAVDGCERQAYVEVMLYDIYEFGDRSAEVFFEQDFTCPYLCSTHLYENEAGATVAWTPIEAPEGEPLSLAELQRLVVLPVMSRERKARGSVRYPYTNRHGAQGFSVYRPLL